MIDHQTLGRYFGYPECCVAWFFTSEMHGRAADWPFSGTGYVPCPECALLIANTSPEWFIKHRIAPRRICCDAFPDHKQRPEEIEEIMRIRELLITSEEENAS